MKIYTIYLQKKNHYLNSYSVSIAQCHIFMSYNNYAFQIHNYDHCQITVFYLAHSQFKGKIFIYLRQGSRKKKWAGH